MKTKTSKKDIDELSDWINLPITKGCEGALGSPGTAGRRKEEDEVVEGRQPE